jgi:hypothetical protein
MTAGKFTGIHYFIRKLITDTISALFAGIILRQRIPDCNA